MTEGNFFISVLNDIFQIIKIILGIFLPLLIGLIIAYLLNPVASFFEGKIKSRIFSIVITYVLVFAGICGLLYGFIVLIIGALPKGDPADTVSAITDYFEDSFDSIDRFLTQAFETEEKFLGFEPDSASLTSFFPGNSFSLSSAIDIISSFTEVIISLFLGIVASIYILKDKEFFLRLWGQFLSLTVKQSTHGIISELLSEINIVISTFLKATFIDSIIVAFLSSVALTIAEVKYAVIIGVIGGFLNIIPYFGPFFSMIPAFIVAFFQTGPQPSGFPRAVIAVVALIIVQQIDSNYIYPKIVGSSTGLHPLFVLVSVSALGYVLGVAGMILAVPIAGIIQVFLRKWGESR